MTELDSERSYDDLPESDVSTVLQVPLLWGHHLLGSPTIAPSRAHRRPSGRHRSKPRPQMRSFDRWIEHPMAQTVSVGLVSAGLVLAAFAGGLFALALWLP